MLAHPYPYRSRKYKATTQRMSITYFKLQDNKLDFRVGIIGSRKIPYILDFCQSTMNITCTCPDYEVRDHKPICKHMYFILNLSNQTNMFNNLTCHDELKDVTKLTQIRESIMAVIDQKKLGSELEESNTVSIERDDFCSICMCDLDEGKIEKCTVCAHVMHIPCITSWWDLSNRWNSIKGKCPYCKDPRGFAHIKQNDDDPWNKFDFNHGASRAQPSAEEQAEPQIQPIVEVMPPVPEVRLPIFVGNPPFPGDIVNVDDPNIQFLFSRLNLLAQEYNDIQNAFEAQAHAQSQ